ncbi:MAG: DNA-directed RNA polymerase subunit beta [Deltaproteobacteria bacterium]|nr:MAG: DNA-directed RNA polymerase subunit beta [Deltaproteobacteria bacterium]
MGVSLPKYTYVRKNFAKIPKVIDIPNLIDIQKSSFENFLQAKIKPEERKDIGLQGAFKSVFPIRDFSGNSSLEFIGYSLDEPKYDVEECRQRGMTYAAPMKIVVQLVIWDINPETKAKTIRDIKEQEVYFGEIPLMTESGTFVINGTERVIVSQLHRSPGLFFSHVKGKTYSPGKLLYSARIIPYRGSWIDFEFDQNEVLYVRIDRRRKLHATILLKALGYSNDELLNYFYDTEKIFLDGKRLLKGINPDVLVGQNASLDIRDPVTKELVIKKDKRFTKDTVKRLTARKIDRIPILPEDILGRFASQNVVDPESGKKILRCNGALTQEKLELIKDKGIKEFDLLFIDKLRSSASLRDTLMADRISNQEEAIEEIYRRLRPGELSSIKTAKDHLETLFFSPDRYDLSRVGRLKLNHRLGLNVPLEETTLRKEDILEIVKYLIRLKDSRGNVDDIDHLGNRRVRTVGELLENQYRIGLVRMEKAIRERMSLQDLETVMPNDLINPKPVMAVGKEFFGSSQLSQFMDQTNPLSEVTHKRRLSALGPGGLTRERAGFEVRDVHTTHYGRICPIETPEGPNIGLIASLSTYARVNEFGFIETPYRKVVNGKVTNEVIYLSALDEENHAITQANTPVDRSGKFISKLVSARRGGEFTMLDRNEIDLMDVSPNQLVSVATSLIPFLEHDDANRALMGSNMQRQAVPLMLSQTPLIGTGMEAVVARDSGVTVVARRDGIVESVDASRIVIRSIETEEGSSDAGVDIYNLVKYQRSNQNTCINQSPIVVKGEMVEKGWVVADGSATKMGELALGRNILVAFMPWGGYNFEDSILISEKMVRDDCFTSIHIEEFECVARDTKLGKEEITKDIPNVGEEALKDLDESGIIRIGAEVKPGDILVGKITPKGETQLSPEEKLLRAIFGDKAGDVRDTSLRVPPGIIGTVINAKVFSRKGVEKDERTKDIEDQEIAKLLKDQEEESQIIQDNAYNKLRKLLLGQKSASKLTNRKKKKVLLKKNEVITEESLEKIPREMWADISLVRGEEVEGKVAQILEKTNEQLDLVRVVFEEKINRLKKGDELSPGVIKMVKVHVAIKRKLSVGDKMAGRHGNKGVVSQILPEEDMPYLEDGTPVDIVLNPLGVPSRMNVGQILETHLGWAAKGLGERIAQLWERKYSDQAIRAEVKKIYNSSQISKFVNELKGDELREFARSLGKGIFMASPVFEGASETEIKEALKQAGLPHNGQTRLYDGRNGKLFDQLVTVGIMYMMKLHHLVDEKIHARSTGPYSLVTQQPLGGKAQFGGQRLGEMEVWALEAYGAAYALQEFLTVKSDDVTGRTRMYEAIVKGKNILEPGLPESFNVLIKEIQSLGLDMQLLSEEEKKTGSRRKN